MKKGGGKRGRIVIVIRNMNEHGMAYWAELGWMDRIGLDWIGEMRASNFLGIISIADLMCLGFCPLG